MLLFLAAGKAVLLIGAQPCIKENTDGSNDIEANSGMSASLGLVVLGFSRHSDMTVQPTAVTVSLHAPVTVDVTITNSAFSSSVSTWARTLRANIAFTSCAPMGLNSTQARWVGWRRGSTWQHHNCLRGEARRVFPAERVGQIRCARRVSVVVIFAGD